MQWRPICSGYMWGYVVEHKKDVCGGAYAVDNIDCAYAVGVMQWGYAVDNNL